MPGAAVSPALTVGFYGKVPARGDFVRAGLPRRFTDPWDEWLQVALTASRTRLGDRFLPAWLEAPIWRFALAPGVCGPDAALGVWMPAVDAAGRCFPLNLVRIGPHGHGGEAFLVAAEQAGLAAIAEDLAPDALLRRLTLATAPDAADPHLPPHGTLWWTAGAPRVAARCLALPGLPDADLFPAMLDEAAP